MGRTKRWSEDMVARFPEGTFAAIEAVSSTGEERTDFVREAVDREILRRWTAMRDGMPTDIDGTQAILRYREATRMTELTSAEAKEDGVSVAITRDMLHAIDRVVVRGMGLLPDQAHDSGALPRRGGTPKRRQP